jgi:uncharacterized membrane protein HdeD (DUF308 family)
MSAPLDASVSGPLMLSSLSRNWWMVLLRGIAAIVFGVLAFVLPGLTLLTLIILYGVYALFDGVVALMAAFWADGRAGKTGSRWWLAVVGVLGILAGLFTFFWPGITTLVLLFFIGAWSLLNGVFTIVGAIRLRKEINNEWWLVASGVLSVLFGLGVLIVPGAGALAVVWIIGTYAILFGVLLVGFALKLKNHADKR